MKDNIAENTGAKVTTKNMNPSPEQQAIVDAVLQNKNVVVDAVAGSGKTTTIIFITKAFLNSARILVLTYNARLKEETRQRTAAFKNVEVHSYHSLCKKYYDMSGYTDLDMLKMHQCAEQMLPVIAPNYNLLILDEQQDMTPLYWETVRRIISHNTAGLPAVVVLGDQNQSIFGFNGADRRYLTQVSERLDTGRAWVRLSLRISYRLTYPMANFINEAFEWSPSGAPHIIAVKDGPPVQYLIKNSFSVGDVYNLVVDFLKCGYQPDDFFILAPSIRGQRSPIVRLANRLSSFGSKRGRLLIFVPNSDEEAIDETIVRNKLVITTFHQVKGLERKIVIIYNFDESYARYTHADLTTCSDTLYVAMSRAKEHLIVIHDKTNRPLPCIKWDLLHSKCQIDGELSKNVHSVSVHPRDEFTVSNLIRHLNVETVDRALKMIQYKTSDVGCSHVRLATKISTSLTTKETVNDLNGIALPAMYQYLVDGECSLMKYIVDTTSRWKTVLPRPEHREYLQSILEALEKCIVIDQTAHFLYLANVYQALSGGYGFKLAQITKYDWLSKKQTTGLLKRFNKYLLPKSRYETEYIGTIADIWTIIGRVDVIDNTTLWEIKCVEQLKAEHIIQAAIYAWLDGGAHTYKLLNILTEEVITITWTPELAEMVQLLVTAKMTNPTIGALPTVISATNTPYQLRSRYKWQAADWEDLT